MPKYTPEEYETKRRLGSQHVAGGYPCSSRRRRETRGLVLIHHDPERTDTQLDGIVNLARAEFEHTDKLPAWA